jgi:hypothetical protein
MRARTYMDVGIATTRPLSQAGVDRDAGCLQAAGTPKLGALIHDGTAIPRPWGVGAELVRQRDRGSERLLPSVHAV